jgi:hypothetical protein
LQLDQKKFALKEEYGCSSGNCPARGIIEENEWIGREMEGLLSAPRAGEILYRLSE